MDFEGTGSGDAFRLLDLRSIIIGEGDRDFFFGVGDRCFFFTTWTCLPEYFSESDGDDDLDESDDLARFFGFDFSTLGLRDFCFLDFPFVRSLRSLLRSLFRSSRCR